MIFLLKLLVYLLREDRSELIDEDSASVEL